MQPEDRLGFIDQAYRYFELIIIQRRQVLMADPQIIQINGNTWRIEDQGVRFFLLTGTEKALLIDSGMSVQNARDIASGLTDLPLSLLNTHADRDHIGSNVQFDRCYMHPDEENHYRRSGGTGEIIPVREGDLLDLGGRQLKIIHLPGHTAGSIAVLDVSGRVLISGDPIQQNGRIFMFGDHRNMDNYIRSLDHLLKYKDEFDEIWPSHADIPISPNMILKLRDGAMEIISGQVQGAPIEVHGKNVIIYDLGFCAFLCDH